MRSWLLSFSDPISAAKSTGRFRREKNSCSRASVAASARQLARTRKKVASVTAATAPTWLWNAHGRALLSSGARKIDRDTPEPTPIETKGTTGGMRRRKRASTIGTATGGTMVAMMSTRILNTPPWPKWAIVRAHDMMTSAQHRLISLARTSRARPCQGAICRRRQRAG